MKVPNVPFALQFPRAFGARDQEGAFPLRRTPTEQAQACLALDGFVLASDSLQPPKVTDGQTGRRLSKEASCIKCGNHAHETKIVRKQKPC